MKAPPPDDGTGGGVNAGVDFIFSRAQLCKALTAPAGWRSALARAAACAPQW
jgi:hypothetical protein